MDDARHRPAAIWSLQRHFDRGAAVARERCPIDADDELAVTEESAENIHPEHSGGARFHCRFQDIKDAIDGVAERVGHFPGGRPRWAPGGKGERRIYVTVPG